MLARRGHHVKFVAVTNGDRGHMDMSLAADRSPLAIRRLAEAKAAVSLFGAQYECVGVHDGDVYVTRELTEQLVRIIRRWGRDPGAGPDLVLVNRPNDYHRDHRYTAQAVLDTSFMLTVPLMCPDVPRLTRMPVFAYWFDNFHEGGAFRPDIVIPLDPMMDAKADILAQHASQFFEWLPFVAGDPRKVPSDPAGRHRFALEWIQHRGKRAADVCRSIAPSKVPTDCQFAEAFQISEYGRQPGADELPSLFGRV